MYARKYYLIIYRNESSTWIYIEKQIFYLNIQEAVINNIQEPIINPLSFYEKSLLTFWLFDLLTFFAFHIHTHKIDRFTKFTIHLVHPIHLVHHSSRSIFTFSLSHFHLFRSSSSSFPHLSPPSPIPLYLTTSGTKTEKIRDNSFISHKNVLTLQP